MPDIFVAPGAKKIRDPREYSQVMANEKRTRNPLATFVVRPKRIKFDTQDKEEEVLLLLRPHWVTNLPWLVIAVIGLFLPWIFLWLPFWSGVPERFKVMMVACAYLLLVGYVWEKFLVWYFNVYMVTDERVIDIDFYSLLYKKVAAAKIDNIEDITYTQGGVVRAMFDFGTVYIQTAGERREFDFGDVPKPRKVVQFLNEMFLEEEREKIEGRVR